jgi:hypothetical protein
MRLLAIRPGPPGGQTIAHVDIEPSPGTRLYGVRVSRADDGTYRAFAATSARGTRSAAFDHEIANRIAKLTVEGLSHNELHHR